MVKAKSLLILLMLLATVSEANTNDMLNKIEVESAQEVTKISRQEIEALKRLSTDNKKENGALIASFLESATAGLPSIQKGQAADGAILFVSFSMPESLLFTLADEAAQFNIPVVINGLVDGDFKKTITIFTRLNQRAKKQKHNFTGLSIDPVWFEQFHITSVPALVVTARPHHCEPQQICAGQPFDVVYGNASVRRSLELIREKGDGAPHIAQVILENGHV